MKPSQTSYNESPFTHHVMWDLLHIMQCESSLTHHAMWVLSLTHHAMRVLSLTHNAMWVLPLTHHAMWVPSLTHHEMRVLSSVNTFGPSGNMRPFNQILSVCDRQYVLRETLKIWGQKCISRKMFQSIKNRDIAGSYGSDEAGVWASHRLVLGICNPWNILVLLRPLPLWCAPLLYTVQFKNTSILASNSAV